MIEIENAILVHGKPPLAKFLDPELLDPSDSNWLPWAKHQLSIRDIFAVAPDMPTPYDPVYEDWKREFERHDVTPRTLLIGFSLGAGFLARWMGENTEQQVAKMVFVAPYLDPNHKYGEFMDFEIDPYLPEACLGGLAIFHSSLDDEQAVRSFDMLATTLVGARTIDIPQYGHYMLGNSMTSNQFPELIHEVFGE